MAVYQGSTPSAIDIASGKSGKPVDYDTGQTVAKAVQPQFLPSQTIDGYEVQRGTENQSYDRVKISGTWYSVPKGTPTSMYQTYAGLAGATPEQLAARERLKEEFQKKPEQFTPSAKAVVEKIQAPENLASVANILSTDSPARTQLLKTFAEKPQVLKPEVQQYLKNVAPIVTTVTSAPRLGGGEKPVVEVAPRQAIPLTGGKFVTSMATVEPSVAGKEVSTAGADFFSKVGSRVGAGLGQVAKTFTPPKPLPSSQPALPSVSLPTKEKIVVPDEIQISTSKETNTQFARVATEKGEARYVPLPSEADVVKASLKDQPFEKFKSTALTEAEKFYDTEAQKIIEGGQVPEPKAEFLARYEQSVTPQLQEKLIREQYPTVTKQYLTQNIDKLPALTRSELVQAEKSGITTEFYRKELAAGNVPVALEALTLSNISVSAPAIVGGIARGLGQEELGKGLIEYSKEEQAKLLSRASIAGETPIGTIGFAVEQLGETYTGVAGTTIAAGIGVGGGVKALGGATGLAKSGVVTKLTEEALLHPNIARAITYGGVAGLTYAFDVGPLIESQAPPGKIVTELAKTGVGIAGFRYGYKYGVEQGLPLKYRDVGFISTEGKRVELAKVLAVEDTGRAKILFSKQPGQPIQFGRPSFAKAPTARLAEAYLPGTATEAQVVESAFSAKGGSIQSVARMEAVQNLLRETYGGPPAVKPSEFKAKSVQFRSMVERGEITPTEERAFNKALTDTVRKYSKEYIEVYGTQAGSLQTQTGTMRPAKDVDILLRAKEDKAVGIANKMVAELRQKGIPAYINEQKPTLISLGSPSPSAPHLVDLHYIGEPTPDVIAESAYGISLRTSTIKAGETPISKLSKETSRKLASVGTIQPSESFATSTVGPELPKRAKDIADVTRYAKNIEAGFRQVGDISSAEKVARATEAYVKTFGKVAIPTEKIAATPLFSYESGTISPTALAQLSSVGASRVKVTPSGVAIETPKGTVVKVTPSGTVMETKAGTTVKITPSGTAIESAEGRSAFLPARSPSPSTVTFSSVSLAPSPSVSAPSRASFSVSSRSPSPSISSASASLRSPSVSPSPSIVSVPPSPPSTSSISPYKSPYSVSVSPSPSSPSVSRSPSPSYVVSPRPYPFRGGSEGKGARETFKLPRLAKVKLAPPTKREKAYGIISEGISKQLFGRATLGKTRGEGSAPTKELLKAGISSPGEFLMRGGYVTSGKAKGRRIFK